MGNCLDILECTKQNYATPHSVYLGQNKTTKASLFGFLSIFSLWLYSWSQLTCSPSVHNLHEHLMPQLSFIPAEAKLPPCSISAFNPLHSCKCLLWPESEHTRICAKNLKFQSYMVFLKLPRQPLGEDLSNTSPSKRTFLRSGTEYKAQSGNSV